MPWVATVNAEGRRALGGLRLRVMGDVLDLLAGSLIIPGFLSSALRLSGVEHWERPLRFGWLVVLLYTVIPVALTGATLGKFIVGQRIERYAAAEAPGLVAALLRYLVATGLPIGALGALVPGLSGLSSLLSLGWLLLILLSIFGDTERRGVHDKVAGTVVVRQR